MWLWRWLPLRLSRRQSLSPTVLFRTTLTRTITLDKLITQVWCASPGLKLESQRGEGTLEGNISTVPPSPLPRSYLSCYSQGKFIHELYITRNFKVSNLKNGTLKTQLKRLLGPQFWIHPILVTSYEVYLAFTKLLDFLRSGRFTST